MARQRSRIRQLSDGDANTAYFHLIERGRKRKNYIPSLTVAGHVMADHEAMEKALDDHFCAVLGTVAAEGITLNFQALGIQPLDLSDQEAPMQANEVWAAIKAMPSDRAPGPDGFTGAFFETAWPVIQNEVMEAIEVFSIGNTWNMGRLNSALVALLPKKVGANSPSDFRPITMIHSFAKLISKILALRLAPRLNEVFDKNQNAFIRIQLVPFMTISSMSSGLKQ